MPHHQGHERLGDLSQLEALRERPEAIDKVTFGSEKLGELHGREQKEQIRDITLVETLHGRFCVISNALLLKHFCRNFDYRGCILLCRVTPKSHETALDAMRMCQINIEDKVRARAERHRKIRVRACADRHRKIEYAHARNNVTQQVNGIWR